MLNEEGAKMKKITLLVMIFSLLISMVQDLPGRHTFILNLVYRIGRAVPYFVALEIIALLGYMIYKCVSKKF